MVYVDSYDFMEIIEKMLLGMVESIISSYKIICYLDRVEV